ncbi:hypothetical protein [Acidocella aromatica]|uniref:Uncharacterized protein n=1 Tax=Acidocella aromatica TaxID=1303579 RepID=A0A840VB70_9PROT|nr:hypothetical protein [Acidocella aromatica]MBB5373023.1 hypothetical protein [Acidocella aromatica]
MSYYDKSKEQALIALAEQENWLAPPMEIGRVVLRPWQQTVFWGLRLYIAVMLAVMGWGFYHNLGQ